MSRHRKVGGPRAPRRRFYDAKHLVAFDWCGRVRRRCDDCGECWPDHTAGIHELAFFGINPAQVLAALERQGMAVPRPPAVRRQTGGARLGLVSDGRPMPTVGPKQGPGQADPRRVR